MSDLRGKHDPAEMKRLHNVEATRIEKELESKRKELVQKWNDGMASIGEQLEPIAKSSDKLYKQWNHASWKKWKPPRRASPMIRIGQLSVQPNGLSDGSNDNKPQIITSPALLSLPHQSPLVLQTGRTGRKEAVDVLQAVMARLFTTLPPVADHRANDAAYQEAG